MLLNHFAVQLLTQDCCSVAQSCLTLCDPWTSAHQACLSFTTSRSLPKLMSIESVMLSNHPILCHHPLLFLPSIFPSICSDKIWSSGEGNGKPLQLSCLENPKLVRAL